MKPLLAVACIVLSFIAMRLILHFGQKRTRSSATRAKPGESLVSLEDGLSVRVMSNASVAGGPVAGRIIQTVGRIALYEERLVIATNQGRMLEMDSDRPGEARAVGPRRLVVLGGHPTGRADLRLEVVIEDEEAWAEMINSRFHTENQAPRVFEV